MVSGVMCVGGVWGVCVCGVGGGVDGSNTKYTRYISQLCSYGTLTTVEQNKTKQKNLRLLARILSE